MSVNFKYQGTLLGGNKTNIVILDSESIDYRESEPLPTTGSIVRFSTEGDKNVYLPNTTETGYRISFSKISIENGILNIWNNNIKGNIVIINEGLENYQLGGGDGISSANDESFVYDFVSFIFDGSNWVTTYASVGWRVTYY